LKKNSFFLSPPPSSASGCSAEYQDYLGRIRPFGPDRAIRLYLLPPAASKGLARKRKNSYPLRSSVVAHFFGLFQKQYKPGSVNTVTTLFYDSVSYF
jgi:hypothetical protein